MSCFNCTAICVNRALETKGYLVDVNSLVSELLRDKPFFEESGGGVTLSGGEPLAQPDFAASLMLSLRENGINTCVETCACASLEALKKVIPHADLIYCDIKHADDSKHRKFTGAGTQSIFCNLAYMLSKNSNVIVRIPVIPGFNHDPESMQAIAGRLARIGVKKVELLPFHQFGEAKYGSLFRVCETAGTRQLLYEDIACHRSIFTSHDIKVLSGG